MEIAEQEADRQLKIRYKELVSEIADEIISTAEEYVPITCCE